MLAKLTKVSFLAKAILERFEQVIVEFIASSICIFQVSLATVDGRSVAVKKMIITVEMTAEEYTKYGIPF